MDNIELINKVKEIESIKTKLKKKNFQMNFMKSYQISYK